MLEGLFQPSHLLLILLIVLIVLWPGKLPEVGAAIGRSVREFRHSVREATSEGARETGSPSADAPSRASQQ